MDSKTTLRVALIIAGAIVISVAMFLYFSPYQSCVRGLESDGMSTRGAHGACAKRLGGSG